MPDVYLTMQELQAKYKVGRGTIDRWQKEGMPCVKIGRTIRFDGMQIEKWIEKQNSADYPKPD